MARARSAGRSGEAEGAGPGFEPERFHVIPQILELPLERNRFAHERRDRGVLRCRAVAGGVRMIHSWGQKDSWIHRWGQMDS